MSRSLYEEGQFDDAPDEAQNLTNLREGPNGHQEASNTDGRGNQSYIDDPALLEWSDEPEEEVGDDEDDLREEDFDDNRVEDEDWDVTERGMF